MPIPVYNAIFSPGAGMIRFVYSNGLISPLNFSNRAAGKWISATFSGLMKAQASLIEEKVVRNSSDVREQPDEHEYPTVDAMQTVQM